MKELLHTYNMLFLSSLLLFSCSSEDRIDTVSEGKYLMQVTLDLEGNSEPSTRVDQTEPGEDKLENRIDSIDILFFDQNNLVWLVPKQSLQINEVKESLAQKKIIISVPADTVSQLIKKKLTMVTVANGPSKVISKIDNLVDLRATVVETELNTEKVQNSFLMTNIYPLEKHIELSEERPFDLGTIRLKRAAAKVRIKIDSITADGYDRVGNPQVALVCYSTKTALLPIEGEEFKIEDNIEYKTSKYEEMVVIDSFWTTRIPFYSYENDWRSDDSKETYLLVKVKFKAKNTSDESALDYYYRIPLNNLKGNRDRARVHRNHLYNINVTIEKLGKEDSNVPLDLEASVSVEKWDIIDNIQILLEKASFLVVKEKDIIMANVSEYQIEYLSSSNIVIKDVYCFYIGYDTSGNQEKVEPGEKPTVHTVSSTGKTLLIVRSDIPKNFVPLYIFFKVENQDGLIEEIKLTQYPPRYITAEQFTINENHYHEQYVGGHPSKTQKNFNLFKVVTLVPESNDLIGDPQDSNGFTKNDEISNKLISPEFIIASQRGVTKDLSYATAQNWCHNYWEEDYGEESSDKKFDKEVRKWVGKNTGKKGYWRMPTLKELEYISRLQRATTSAVKGLLTGNYYWSAQITSHGYYSLNVQNGYINNTGKAYPIRCVFDSYKHVQK